MKPIDTFSDANFELLKSAEDRYFWFSVRRKWIFDKIRNLVPPPAQFLEIGCGTGNVSSFLATKGFQVTGCEYYERALSMAWPGFEKVRGDAKNLPFEDNSFDIVGLFDVIEHFEDATVVLGEAGRVVRRGGIVAVTVPAQKELWSSYDELACHKRRYTRQELCQVFRESNLSPVLLEYMFMTLYVPARVLRNTQRAVDLAGEFRIHPLTNAVFRVLCSAERILSRFLPLPIGTSLIALAKKQ